MRVIIENKQDLIFPPSFHSFSSLDGSLLCRMDTLVFAVKWSLYHQNSNYYTNTFYTSKKYNSFLFHLDSANMFNCKRSYQM